MPITRGFDPKRDEWSRDATKKFFPAIVHDVFGEAKITYAWQAGIDRLDKYYGVDAIVATPQRNIAIAIRVRGYEYYEKFWDITLRNQSLQTLGKRLETQKSIARFMTYFWVNADRPQTPTTVVGTYTIHLQLLVDQWIRGDIPFVESPNKDPSSTLVGFAIKDLWERNLLFAYTDQKWIPPVRPTVPAINIYEGDPVESAQQFFERRFTHIDDHLEHIDQRVERVEQKVNGIWGWMGFVGKLMEDIKATLSLRRSKTEKALPTTPTLWDEDNHRKP